MLQKHGTYDPYMICNHFQSQSQNIVRHPKKVIPRHEMLHVHVFLSFRQYVIFMQIGENKAYMI